MAGRRRDSKHRVLRRGESIRADGKYQFKYHVNGTPHFVYSWRLEPTDKLPAGKKPCLSLRELEKQASRLYPGGMNGGEDYPRIVNRKHFDRLSGLMEGQVTG